MPTFSKQLCHLTNSQKMILYRVVNLVRFTLVNLLRSRVVSLLRFALVNIKRFTLVNFTVLSNYERTSFSLF